MVGLEKLAQPMRRSEAGRTTHLAALRSKVSFCRSEVLHHWHCKQLKQDRGRNQQRGSKKRWKSDEDIAGCGRAALMCAAEIRINQSRAQSRALNSLKCQSWHNAHTHTYCSTCPVLCILKCLWSNCWLSRVFVSRGAGKLYLTCLWKCSVVSWVAPSLLS